ncbi:PhoH family protein [Klebsiella pneumoniae]
MGTSRKHARKVARKAVKENRAFRGRRVDYVIVDELTDAQTPRPKRDNTPVEARNEAQAHYLISIENKPLTFATGEAGCGKTFLATAVAAQKLLDKDVRKIIVTRPVLQADEDLGASFLEYCLKPEIAKVEIAPFAYMRGRTFENAVVILDEAQNVTPSQMKMFLTRMGENVTVIVNGDVTQCDLPGNKESGLSDALRRFKPNAHVGLIEFEADDCVRSELCKVALNAYQ